MNHAKRSFWGTWANERLSICVYEYYNGQMPRPKKSKAGRPALPEGTARVVISGRVKPETKAKIESTAETASISIGEVLDDAFAQGTMLVRAEGRVTSVDPSVPRNEWPRTQDTIQRLCEAVEAYVIEGGGKLSARGGIQILPIDKESYRVSVKCVGTKPDFAKG